MRDQIKMSLPYEPIPYQPDTDTNDEWRTKQLAKIDHDIAYYTQERDKEVERIEQATKWIAQLYDSLEKL